jgi:hypothetical protein
MLNKGKKRDELAYHLPASFVRVTGTVTKTEDSLGTDTTAAEATIALETDADATRRTATFEQGTFRDTAVAFELTEDGRFVSSSVESTGEAGKVVVGVLTAGGAIAGAALGSLSPAGAAGMLALAAGTAPRTGGMTVKQAGASAGKPAKRDKVTEAYEHEFPGAFELVERYAQIIADLGIALAAAIEGVEHARSTHGERAATYRIAAIQNALAVATAQKERLDAHFKAWRATKIETHVEHHEHLLSLDALRAAGTQINAAGEVQFAAGAKGELGKRLWDTLGVAIVVEPAEGLPAPQAPQMPTPGDNAILVRSPRQARISLYRNALFGKAKARAELVESKPYLVMDELSDVAEIDFRKSIWAKRAKTLKFSTSGALTSYASTADAAAGAIADAAKDAPAAIAGGLEQAKNAFAQVDALRSRGIDQQIARLTKQVELKQQEIAQAGLTATQGSAAELERLKQQVDILTQKKAIGDFHPAADPVTDQIAELKKQIDLTTAQQQLATLQNTAASNDRLAELLEQLVDSPGERQSVDITGRGGQ